MAIACPIEYLGFYGNLYHYYAELCDSGTYADIGTSRTHQCVDPCPDCLDPIQLPGGYKAPPKPKAKKGGRMVAPTGEVPLPVLYVEIVQKRGLDDYVPTRSDRGPGDSPVRAGRFRAGRGCAVREEYSPVEVTADGDTRRFRLLVVAFTDPRTQGLVHLVRLGLETDMTGKALTGRYQTPPNPPGGRHDCVVEYGGEAYAAVVVGS